MRSKQYSPCFEVGLETPFAFRIVQGDCVCVCVRERERERETDRQTDRKRESCSYRKMERYASVVGSQLYFTLLYILDS